MVRSRLVPNNMWPVGICLLVLMFCQSEAVPWRSIPTTGIPDGRHEGCFVWNRGKAYLIGGRGNPFVSEFDPIFRKWTNHSASSRRDIHHTQCVSLNGKIWFPNAWYRGFPREKNTEYLAVYDPKTQKWDTKTHPALPEQRRRGGGASVVHNGKIYTSHGNSGGHNTNATLLSMLDVYDPRKRQWQSLPDARYPRDHTGGAVVVDYLGRKRFCVAGGRESNHGFPESFNKFVTPTECYNFKTRTWKTRKDIPTPRAGASYGTTCDGKLVVIGGEVAGSGRKAPALDVVEVFDGRRWIKDHGLKEGRHGSGVVFDCRNRCQRAYIASGNPTRGGGPDLTSTERQITCPAKTTTTTTTTRPVTTTTTPKTTTTRKATTTTTTKTPKTTTTPKIITTKTPETITTTVVATTQKPQIDGLFKKYVSCSGVGTIIDGLGRKWEPDVGLFGRKGKKYSPSFPKKISNPDAPGMDKVYKSQRYHPENLAYRLTDLPNGFYKVTLHFMEQNRLMAGIGRRRFNVFIQNRRVLRNYDPFAVAGSKRHKATRRLYYAKVVDGILRLNLKKGAAGFPMISAFAVEQMPANFKPPSLSATDDEGESIRISVGSDSPVDANGVIWLSDAPFHSEGVRRTRKGSVTKILNLPEGADVEVMRTLRFDKNDWSISVPNISPGIVRVVLHFAELNPTITSAGSRLFDVRIQGAVVLNDFDVMGKAGAPFVTISEEFEVEVNSDGTLKIDMLKGKRYNPFLSALEIFPKALESR